MPDPQRNDPLLEWGLATFHTAFFILSLVLLAFSRGILGDLLGGLDTAIGFALFGILWVITWGNTRRALRQLGSDFPRSSVSPGKAFGTALTWGAVNGFLFSLVLLILFASITLVNSLRNPGSDVSMASLLFIGLTGLLISLFVGAAIGLVFALIDWALFGLARIILPRN